MREAVFASLCVCVCVRSRVWDSLYVNRCLCQSLCVFGYGFVSLYVNLSLCVYVCVHACLPVGEGKMDRESTEEAE